MSTQSIASDNYFYSVQTNKRILGKYTAVRMIAILHENQLVSGKDLLIALGCFFFVVFFWFFLVFYSSAKTAKKREIRIAGRKKKIA